MTCPDPTLGTLTGMAGTFGGIQASTLVDVYHKKDPTRWQWQWTSILTDKSGNGGGCARFQRRQRQTGEMWLLCWLIGSRTNAPSGDYGYCPPPPTPITLSAKGDTQTFSEDGLSYWVAPVKFVPFGDRCREGKPVTATGGTITFTNLVDPYTWDDANPHTPSGEVSGGIVEAILDNVTFANGQSVSGSFSAPFCSTQGCPAPPSSWQCVS